MFFTDPVRTPHPEAVAERLPAGSAVVYRAFGAPDALPRALRLAEICRRRRLLLLVGAVPELARAAGADGVHLPERSAARAAPLKRQRPDWLVTAAAHDVVAARRAARAGADAVVVSAVFASASPSAGPPMGVLRLASLARRVEAPVYALGGVRNETARRLLDAGVAGIAAVEGVAG